MKKTIGWLLTIVLLAGLGLGIWRWQKARKVIKVDYSTESVRRKRVVGRVTASGTLQAKVTVQVGAQVSGRIMKITVDFNSTVKKGQLIAELDPLLYLAALKQSQANYASAKADCAKAQAQQRDAELVLQRVKALAEQSLATAADLQTAETTVAVARAYTDSTRAEIMQATASLNQANVNLSYTRIYSPIDGTVISRAVDVGQTVASSLAAPVLFTIAEDLRTMQVYTNISEGDVGRLETGMPTSFTVDAFPGQRFRGKVGQIRNAAQIVQNVVTYNAVIDAENPNLKLRPGMTATVNITYAERDDVLTISNSALRFRPPTELTNAPGKPGPFGTVAPAASGERGPGRSGQPGQRPLGSGRSGGGDAVASPNRTVWLLQGNKPAVATIQVGLSDGTVTEVTGGNLREGDLAITDATIAGSSSILTATSPGANAGPPRMGRMF
jgi:HlyD family secretion protein